MSADGDRPVELGGDPRRRLDLPYEEVPGGPVRVELPPETLIATGLTVRSAVFASPITGRPMAAPIFDFVTPDGGQVAPIVLVLEDDQLVSLAELIRDAVRSGRRAARREAGGT